VASELADEEALRIHDGEAGGVVEPRIPAFRRRPVGGERNLVGPHGANCKIVLRGHGRPPRAKRVMLCPHEAQKESLAGARPSRREEPISGRAAHGSDSPRWQMKKAAGSPRLLYRHTRTCDPSPACR